MVEMKNDTYGEFKYSNEIFPLFVFSEDDERTSTSRGRGEGIEEWEEGKGCLSFSKLIYLP